MTTQGQRPQPTTDWSDREFLNRLKKDGVPITCCMNSGKLVSGRITSFGTYSILLKTMDGGTELLIFKHALAWLERWRSTPKKAG